MPKRVHDQLISKPRSLVALLPNYDPPDQLWHVMYHLLPDLREDEYSEDRQENDTNSSQSSDSTCISSPSSISSTCSPSPESGSNPITTSSLDTMIATNVHNFIDLTIDDGDDDNISPGESVNSPIVEDMESAAPSVTDILDFERELPTSPSAKQEESILSAVFLADQNPGEGSLFISGDSDIIDLTEEEQDRLTPQSSPREALRAIEAHVHSADRHRGSADRQSETTQSTSLFASDTPYAQIVPSTFGSISGSNAGSGTARGSHERNTLSPSEGRKRNWWALSDDDNDQYGIFAKRVHGSESPAGSSCDSPIIL